MRMHHVGNGSFKRCVAKSDESCEYGPGKIADSFHGSTMNEVRGWYEAQREGDMFATSKSTGAEDEPSQRTILSEVTKPAVVKDVAPAGPSASLKRGAPKPSHGELPKVFTDASLKNYLDESKDVIQRACRLQAIADSIQGTSNDAEGIAALRASRSIQARISALTAPGPRLDLHKEAIRVMFAAGPRKEEVEAMEQLNPKYYSHLYRSVGTKWDDRMAGFATTKPMQLMLAERLYDRNRNPRLAEELAANPNLYPEVRKLVEEKGGANTRAIFRGVDAGAVTLAAAKRIGLVERTAKITGGGLSIKLNPKVMAQIGITPEDVPAIVRHLWKVDCIGGSFSARSSSFTGYRS